MTWTCTNCGADGNKGHACRKCLASQPAAPKPQSTYAPPCIYCRNPTEERRYQRQTTFGPMTQVGRYCPTCESWQV